MTTTCTCSEPQRSETPLHEVLLHLAVGLLGLAAVFAYVVHTVDALVLARSAQHVVHQGPAAAREATQSYFLNYLQAHQCVQISGSDFWCEASGAAGTYLPAEQLHQAAQSQWLAVLSGTAPLLHRGAPLQNPAQ